MEHIQGSDRHQMRMICLDQWVDQKAFVRIIDAFVDHLDLKQFAFSYFDLNQQGRPPFHPSILLKLYLYGYHYGIRSSRKLQRACATNVEVMWLLKERKPHYKTIANFRKDNAKAFRKVFQQFVFILKDWKLIEGKTIAIDSFKIRAQNSLKNNFNETKIKRHLQYIDNKIDEYERLLEQQDIVEHDKKDLHLKIEHQQNKKDKFASINQQLKLQSDRQISLTDPDAKAVVFQRNAVKVGYNIQAATDAKNKLIVAMDTGNVNDTKALGPMVLSVKQNLKIDSFDVLADKGYHSGRELKDCQQYNVTTFVSPKQSSSTKKNPDFAMHKFIYNENEDSYTCPAGAILNTNGRQYFKKLINGRKSYYVKHYKTKACKNCQLRSQCTKNKNGRYIERSEYQEYIKSNNDRVNENPDYYRERQQIIEHQFGTIKRHWGFDYVLTKGKENVLAETALVFIVYNLRRSLSILDFDSLMAKLKDSICEFLSFFNLLSYREDQADIHLLIYQNTHCKPHWKF